MPGNGKQGHVRARGDPPVCAGLLDTSPESACESKLLPLVGQGANLREERREGK